MKPLKIFFLTAIFFVISCKTPFKSLDNGLYAVLETEKGNIAIQFYQDESPITVANFVALSKGKHPYVADSLSGRKFYNGLTFHRVVPNFVIQGGDIKGTGEGQPGYRFIDEVKRDSLGKVVRSHDKKGIVAMANAGPNTNGSQFYITHKPTVFLDGDYSVFGEVVEGLNVVDSIQKGDKINKVHILKRGKLAKRFKASAILKKQEKNFVLDKS